MIPSGYIVEKLFAEGAENIDTNEVTHYTPKLYDKGGWNVPDIAYWLDVELPKEIEL